MLTGPPDDFERVTAALRDLQGDRRLFTVRCYDSFQDANSPFRHAPSAPTDFVRYAHECRPLDLVLQYRSASADVEGYLSFLSSRIQRYARLLYSVQITEEPNFVDGPDVIDGPYPEVARALVEGVVEAKRLLRSLGRPQVKVGFNSTPTFGPGADFWTGLSAAGTEFLDSLDYVGLDFFPDVFRAVAPDGEPGDLASSVRGVFQAMRSDWLPKAGIPESIPIYVCEHGWPTNQGRSEDRQARVLDCTIRTIYDNRVQLNLGAYSLFALRDVALRTPDNVDNPFSFFGIMTADYQRKLAFETYRELIASLGT